MSKDTDAVQTQFVLDDEQWEVFNERLAQVAVVKPKLAELLSADDPFVDE